MWVRPSGKSIDTREVQPKKPQSAIEVTPLGTTTWPCASGVYKQTAAAPPSASSSKVVGRISCQLKIGRTVSAIGRPSPCSRPMHRRRDEKPNRRSSAVLANDFEGDKTWETLYACN